MEWKENLDKIRAGTKVYIDTVIWIYHLERTDKVGNTATQLLTTLLAKRCKIVISPLVITELCGETNGRKVLNTLLLVPNLICENLDIDTAFHSAQLRRSCGFKNADSIHLFTAIKSKCKYFITNDIELKKCKGIEVITLE